MPIKRSHEFRDPLHNFIELNRQERRLVDAEPFQRLRHINQLALTPLVYPGATHKRFEHSLGVMHLAKTVFDVVTDPANIHPAIEHVVPDSSTYGYWKTTLALAALSHDMGHLPFSHAAEKQLLPKGEDHENLTLDLIDCDHLSHVWGEGQPVLVSDVKKLAVGQKKLRRENFSTWQSLLSELIVGDSFGVDRIDYLLRDSYHAGVNYGKFDHLKLISSLRILPDSSGEGGSVEPRLGVELNGLHSAEAMLLARYFMYEQVYFHPVRRIYDLHLIDFMVSHYGANGYSKDVEYHLSQTDNEVTAALRSAFRAGAHNGHAHAKAILGREHFRLVYTYNPSDQSILQSSILEGRITPELNQPFNSPAHELQKALIVEFGSEQIKKDQYLQGSSPAEFPVLMPDGRIESSVTLSPILANFPLMTVDSIYADPTIADAARHWLSKNREDVLRGEYK